MLKILTETGLSYKVGIMTASSPFVIKMLATLQWIDVNITQIGLWISALVGLSLFVSHVCKTVWDNRKNTAEISQLTLEGKKKDLELEELKLRVELLKLELKEKQE